MLVLPPFGCETKRVYENHQVRLTSDVNPASISRCTTPERGEVAVSWGFSNDLEPSAMNAYPELLAIRERIVAAGFPQVCLSGSGSTLFVAFEDESTCVAAHGTLGPTLSSHGDVVLWCTESARERGSPQPGVFPSRRRD